MHRSLTPARALRGALALLPILLAGCGDDGGSDGTGPPAADPILAKASPSGDAQTGPVAGALPAPLRVLVTLDGAPEAGRSITWTALDGDADPPTSTTGADGIATTGWTLGTTAGPQVARATLAGATGSPVSFSATATAGPAAALAKVSGDDQVGQAGAPAPAPIVVRVADQFGNPVAGTTVGFAITGGSANLSAGEDVSGADGRADVTFTFGAEPGEVTIAATATGLTGSPQVFQAESGHVLVTNNQFQPAALIVPAGTTVRWLWSAGATDHNITPDGGTEPAASATSAAPFAYTHTFNTPGTYDYECTVHPGMAGTITVQ